MAHLRKHRPAPAMVVACIALFVALGGTGVAVVTAQAPRNSVGTLALRNGAVTSAKVKDFTLVRKDFKQGTLLRGPAGPAGPAGAAGAAGAVGPAGPGARWALVRGDGTIIAQSGGVSPTTHTTGSYILDFGSQVTGKLIIASSANVAPAIGDRGTVSAGPCGGTAEGSVCPTGNDVNHVRVITRQPGNLNPGDFPFYIAVIG
jgi:hypothetical protein